MGTGLAEVDKSITLDPLSPFTNAQAGWLELRHGNFDRAIEGFSKAIELNSNLAIGHLLLGQTLILKGRFPDAITELREAERISPGDAWAKACLVYACAASGRRDLATSLLGEVQKETTVSGYRRSLNVALAYTGLGDKDRAFEFLDKAIEEHDPLLSLITMDHLYDPLHSDPRWTQFIRKVGFVRQPP